MSISTFDLKEQNSSLKQEMLDAISKVIDDNSYITGKYLEQFEKNFATYCGINHVVGVGNGTDALILTLDALLIKDGAEVIIPANTYHATALAAKRNNAKIKLVDVDESTYNIDVSKIEDAITPNTDAILPVHLYGQPCDIEGILGIAEKHSLKVVFDCAQAHGATYDGRNIGFFGSAACFSFYPSKNLGALGDGGAIATNNKNLSNFLRVLREYGQESKNTHTFIGYNSRLDPVQAVALDIKLRLLDKWNERRRQIAENYKELLGHLIEKDRFEIPETLSKAEPVYHLFPIIVDERDRLQEYLKTKSINLAVHYPYPIHLQPAFSYLLHKKGDFPVAEKCARSELSLPMYPELREEQIQYVCDAIKAFYASKKSK